MSAASVLDRSISEADWQRTVTEYASLNAWVWYHVNDSRRDRRGFPDLVLVRGGRLVFAELKREAGRVRPEQRFWLVELAQCPHVETYVWRPRDWPTVERVLA